MTDLSTSRTLPFAAGVLLSVLVFGAYARYCAHPAYETNRAAEAELLRASGVIVAERADRTALEDRIIELERNNTDLAAAIARARKVAPKAKPTVVIAASTGPVTATGVPAPIERAAKGCLLAEGDTAEIRVAEVALRTDADNTIVVGQATALRLFPAPETVIANGTFNTRLSTASVAAPEATGGWPGWLVIAVGAVGVLGGFAVGAAF